METGDEINLSYVYEKQLQNAAFCKESFVFTCLTYKNVQSFRKGPVHKFYDLKMSKVLVLTNTHMLKKSRIKKTG